MSFLEASWKQKRTVKFKIRFENVLKFLFERHAKDKVTILHSGILYFILLVEILRLALRLSNISNGVQ